MVEPNSKSSSKKKTYFAGSGYRLGETENDHEGNDFTLMELLPLITCLY